MASLYPHCLWDVAPLNRRYYSGYTPLIILYLTWPRIYGDVDKLVPNTTQYIREWAIVHFVANLLNTETNKL